MLRLSAIALSLLSTSAFANHICENFDNVSDKSQCYREYYANENNVTAYWAGWSTTQVPDFAYSANLLSFSTLNSEFPPYSFSNDEFLDPSSWNYRGWSNWKGGGSDILSVGGGSDVNIAKVMYKGNHANRVQLYNAIVDKIIDNNLDGVDIDIESWWNYSTQERAIFSTNLAEMVIYLREQFNLHNQPELKISVSLAYTANSWMGNFFRNSQAMNYVDDIFIMTYTDFTVGFYTNPRLIDSYISAYTNAGAPLDKLRFGVSPMINMHRPQEIASLEDIAWFASYVKSKGMKGVFYWAIGAKTTYQQNSDAEYVAVLAKEFDFIDELPQQNWNLSIRNESPSVGVQIKIDSFTSDYLAPNSSDDYSSDSFISTNEISGKQNLNVNVFYWGVSALCSNPNGSIFSFDFNQDTTIRVLNVNPSLGIATCSL